VVKEKRWHEERRRRHGGKKSSRGEEESSQETTASREEVAHDKELQETQDIKIAKPLCLCKNIMFGPSNVKFAKMPKSNA